MSTLNEAVEDFLTHKRIAVAGVSRSGSKASNLIYLKLPDASSEVFAFNPNADVLSEDEMLVMSWENAFLRNRRSLI